MKHFFISLAFIISFLFSMQAKADETIRILDAFGDVKIEIVDYFPDEKWQFTSFCSGAGDTSYEIVDAFGDIKVEIVDYFPDKKICIANKFQISNETKQKLGLE